MEPFGLTKLCNSPAASNIGIPTIRKVLSSKPINRVAFLSTIQALWHIDNRFRAEAVSASRNTFAFYFESEKDRRYVLEVGPWNFHNHLIVLVQSKGLENYSIIQFTYASFWIQLHIILLFYMNQKIRMELGKMIGVVEEIDLRASGECFGKYLRLHIKIDISMPLKGAVGQESNNQGKLKSNSKPTRDTVVPPAMAAAGNGGTPNVQKGKVVDGNSKNS
ncbi:conserved hypothetical protein [Ricinus communis]|uniref:Uncharacterized protein n=1 Tax=Ricinus communis TaxID=3988 RepID=B9S5H5_RICCO|nr:conserved hypothetical protein [Ricinus communis]